IDDDFEEAQRHLKWCLRLWPRSPDGHLLAAQVERYLGNIPAAEEHLRRCKELQGHPSSEWQLEWILLRLRTDKLPKREEEQLWANINSGQPQSAAILIALAESYLRQGRAEMAQSCLARCLKIDSDNPRAFALLGVAFSRLNSREGAIMAYENA